MITVSTEWASLSKRPGKPILVARMYYGAEGAGDYVPIASTDLTLGVENFLGVVKNVPNVVSLIDMKDHGHSISSFKLGINNLEFQPGKRFSDWLEELGAGADIGFDNRKVDVRLFLPGITSFANCFPLMENGIVRESPHGHEDLEAGIEDRSEMVMVVLGDRVEESDAASGEGGNLPEETKGTIKPKIIGDHLYYCGHSSDATLTTAKRDHNLVPARYLGLDTAGKHRWLISDHQMDAVPKLWAKDPNINRTVEVAAFDIEQNTSAGCIVSIATDVDYWDYFYGNNHFQNLVQDDATWLNPEDACDSDPDTTTECSVAPDDPADSGADVDLVFDGYNSPVDDIDISDIEVWVKAKFHMGTALVVADIEFDINEVDITGIGEDVNTVVQAGTEAASTLGANAEVTIHFARINKTGVNTGAYGHVYEVWKKIIYSTTEILPVFSGGRGWEYGTWINDRSVGEGYTETHADDDDAGELIENFAGAAESFLRDQLDLGDTEINRDSFNIASNDVSGFKISDSIEKETEPSDYIKETMSNCRSFLWWAGDGTYKMKTLLDAYTASDRKIDVNDLTELKFDRTKLSGICTVCEVWYNWDGEKFKSKTAQATAAVMATKYNVTLSQSTLRFKAYHIKDSASAIALRGYLLAQWKQPHNIAIANSGKENLDLDIGDIIEFMNMPYKVRGEDITGNVVRNGQTIYKYWWIFNVERSKKMQFEAFQLHAL